MLGWTLLSERKPYKTDLPDGQWALIKSVITAPRALVTV